MPSTIRVALYVFAAVAVLLWITILSVYESRQGSGPPAELLCCLEDLPYGELHDFYSPPPSSPLFALSRDERGEVFRMEILEAGFPCDGVTLMERWGVGSESRSSSHVQLWFVDCQDGQFYSIQVDPFDPSGSTTVAVAARLGPTK